MEYLNIGLDLQKPHLYFHLVTSIQEGYDVEVSEDTFRWTKTSMDFL